MRIGRSTSLPYALVCTAVGLLLGWVPALFHGPIPQKFDAVYMRGDVAVWAFYSARLLIGLSIGITCLPRRWYLRGPLCGFLALLPVSLIALANPGCGARCTFWNLLSAVVLGGAVAGVAFLLTGRHHALETRPG
ncbi:MAG: hypothetical protein AB1689_09170 [Thermodesulfobacteriota bacterium]